MPSIDQPTLQRVNLLVNYLTGSKAYKPTSSPGQQVVTTQSSFFSQPSISLDANTLQKGQMSLISACNELVEITGNATSISVPFDIFERLENNHIESWKLLRAGLLATIYGRNVDEDVRANFRHRFMTYTRHDDVPINRKQFPYESRVIHEEVLWGMERLYNIHSGFSHFHISTQRPNLNTPSMLESFIKHVNGSAKSYSPSQIQIRDGALTRRGTINDFPGPGFIIDGLGKVAELFPKGFVESSYPQISKPSSELTPKDTVENKYRKVLVNSERDLKDTQFAVFRGVKIITNPKKMVIDGKSYALIIYNDHFHNDEYQEIAFLIPHGIITAFLKNPLAFVNAHTNFHPGNLMQKYGPEIIVPVYESALGGFDKTFPFNPGAPRFYKDEPRYDQWGHEHRWHLCHPEKRLNATETFDSKGYIHRTHDFAGLIKPGTRTTEHAHYWDKNYDYRNYAIDKLAHDEVRNCLFFAMSQYDLLKSAFRLNTFGYEYNTKFQKWTRDEFKMLRTAIGLRESERYSANEKPILVGVEQNGNSRFREDFIRQGGFLDTKSMLWRRSSSNKEQPMVTKMLPGLMPDPVYDLKNIKTWQHLAGVENTKNWLDLQAGLYDLGAEPVFYFGQESFKNQLAGVVKKSGENHD